MEVGRWVGARAWEARLPPEDGGAMGGDRGREGDREWALRVTALGGDGDRADALP